MAHPIRSCVFLPVLVLAAAGCYSYRLAKPDPPPIAALAPPPADVAQICVLRPHWIAGAVTFVVRDNGVLVGATRGPTHFCYYAEPGTHRVTTEADSLDEAQVVVAAGGNYYLHQVVENIFGHVRSRSTWIAPSEAPALVEKCAYRVLVGVPGNETLPSVSVVARASTAPTAASP